MYMPKKFKVKASDGLRLRREPTLNSKTTDGNDNVIRVLKFGTIVQQISGEVSVSGGHNWYHVTPMAAGMNETGWVASGFLEEYVPGPVTGPPSVTYTFKFGGVTYRITKAHLAAARPQFIFDTRKPNSQQIIISGKKYYTTQENINAMKDPSRKWIT